MTKILFIYGYGGSPESSFCTLLREALPADEYEVLCPMYPQQDCAEAHTVLMKFIAENGVDLVVGTSLGGFVALTMETQLPTIVLNPCMLPSVELPLLQPRPDHPEDQQPSAEMIAMYRPYEVRAFQRSVSGRRVMGLFAENDELLGTKYKTQFAECYGMVRDMPGGHHGNREAVPAIVDAIRMMCELKN